MKTKPVVKRCVYGCFLIFLFFKVAGQTNGLESTPDQRSARRLIKSYIREFRRGIPLSPEKIRFIASFTGSTRDISFRFFNQESMQLDKVMGHGYSEGVVEYLVTKEYMASGALLNEVQLKDDPIAPNWEEVGQHLRRRFGMKTADRVIIDQKIAWYRARKDWHQLAKYTIMRMDEFGPDTAGMAKAFLNNFIYGVIFLHIDNADTLSKGITLMKTLLTIEPDPVGYANELDTYAELLYKLGDTAAALKMEERALKMFPENPDIKSTYIKMRSGEKTWTE